MKFRTWLCGGLAAVLLATPALAAGFSDTAGHWAEGAVDRWSGHGILTGYGSGAFGPGDPITRAQMAALLDRLFGWTGETEADPFADLTGDEWYAGAVLRAAKAGVLQGSGGYVRPNDPITRQETAVMLQRALMLTGEGEGRTFPDGAEIAPWAGDAVDTLSALGLLTGGDGGLFQPLRSITRAETAALLDRAVAGYYDAAGVYSESQTGAVTIIAAPGVTLRDVTVDGDLIIAPGAGGSETILSNVTVTGATRVLSGKDNQVLALAGSSLGEVSVSGADARLKLEGGAAADSITVTGSGAHIRGLAEDQQVTVAEGAENVLVNGHDAAPGTTVTAGADVSTDADDMEVVIEPEDKPSGGGTGGGSTGGGGGGQTQPGEPDTPEDPDTPGEPDVPEDPDTPDDPDTPEKPSGGVLDEEGNLTVDFDDLLGGR